MPVDLDRPSRRDGSSRDVGQATALWGDVEAAASWLRDADTQECVMSPQQRYSSPSMRSCLIEGLSGVKLSGLQVEVITADKVLRKRPAEAPLQ